MFWCYEAGFWRSWFILVFSLFLLSMGSFDTLSLSLRSIQLILAAYAPCLSNYCILEFDHVRSKDPVVSRCFWTPSHLNVFSRERRHKSAGCSTFVMRQNHFLMDSFCTIFSQPLAESFTRKCFFKSNRSDQRPSSVGDTLLARHSQIHGKTY